MADTEESLIALLQSVNEAELHQLIIGLQGAAQYEDIIEVLCLKFDTAKSSIIA